MYTFGLELWVLACYFLVARLVAAVIWDALGRIGFMSAFANSSCKTGREGLSCYKLVMFKNFMKKKHVFVKFHRF